MKRRLAAYLLVLLALPAPPAAAEDGDLATRWKQLRAKAMRDLHELAAWCAKAKLFADRADVYESILTFDPDDEKARKRLKYKRTKEGAWERHPRYKRPKNLDKGHDRFLKRRARLGEAFAAEAAALVEEAEDAAAYRVRAEVVAGALGVDPANATFRSWNREIKVGDEWFLKETQVAAERRKGIRDTARKALRDLPKPKEGTARKEDLHGKSSWKTVLDSARVRVLGTVDAAECERMVRGIEACWPVMRYAVGESAPNFKSKGRYGGAGFTLYAFDNVSAANAFFGAQPTSTPRDQEFTARLVAAWIPKRNARIVKSTEETTRLEAASRGPMGVLMRWVTGLNRKRAWIAEGLKIYLNYQICRTRTIYTVNDDRSGYAEKDKPIPEYHRRMSDSDANWLALGLQMMKSADKPDPYLLSGKDYNTITRAEMLYGYCVAAYAVEGWPKRAAELFKTIAAEHGTDIDRVLLEVFQLDARLFEQRMMRWLEETTR